jgi:hypothetical protein
VIELKYNESSQLQVRLAILESHLKVANNKIKHLEKINKEENSLTKPYHFKWAKGLGQEGNVPNIELRLYI